MADDRTYIRVHDGMDEHPKIEALSDAAFRALHRCWYYSSRQRTNGRLTEAAFRNRAKTPKVRRELLDAGLVHPAGHDCPHDACITPPDGHVQMHDYLEHQRSAEEIRLLQEVRGDTGSYGNHVRWHVVRRKPKKDCGHCRAEGDPIAKPSQMRSQTDRKPIASTETEAEAEVPPTYVGGGSHVSRADGERPPAYPDHCPDHAHVAVPPKCGGCQKQKAWNEQHRPALQLVPADTRRCLVHDQTYTHVCSGCRADEIAAEETA